jgi:hypothetical protein
MNLERIRKLLKQKENIRLEFKEARSALPDNLFDTICETFEFLPVLSLRGAERRSNLMVYRMVMGLLRRPLASSQ